MKYRVYVSDLLASIAPKSSVCRVLPSFLARCASPDFIPFLMPGIQNITIQKHNRRDQYINIRNGATVHLYTAESEIARTLRVAPLKLSGDSTKIFVESIAMSFTFQKFNNINHIITQGQAI